MRKCPKSWGGGVGVGSVWNQGEGFVTERLAFVGGHSKIGAEARKRKTRSRTQGSFRGLSAGMKREQKGCSGQGSRRGQ